MHIACALLLLLAPEGQLTPLEDVVVVDVLATITHSETVPGRYEGVVLEAANHFSEVFTGGTWSMTPAVRGWPKSEEDAEALLWDRFFAYDAESPSWVANVDYSFAIYDTNGNRVSAAADARAVLTDADHDSLAEDSDFASIEIGCALDPPTGTGAYTMIGDYPAETGGVVKFSSENTSPWWLAEEVPPDGKADETTIIRIYWRQPPTAVEPATWAKIKNLYK